MRELLVVLSFIAVVAILEGLYYFIRFWRDRRMDEVRRRLQNLALGYEATGRSLLRDERYARTPGLDSLLRAMPFAPTLEGMLVEADLALTVAELLALCGGLGGTTLLLAVSFRVAWVAALALALLVALMPIGFVMVARERRSGQVSEQLPDALDMMARSLRAGHAVPNTFQFVASEMPAPISLEFGRAFEEQRLGKSLEEAVVSMTERVPRNRDLRIFAVSINIQRDTGGNLAEILEKIAETIRSRYRFYGKLRSLTAEGRMSGAVLGSLPIGMMLFMAIANPTYLSSLFDSLIGLLFLGYAITSWAVGLAWMFSMTKVEF